MEASAVHESALKRAIRPARVERAMIARMARLLQASEAPEELPMNVAQVQAVRDSVSRLSPAWPFIATRICLNLWASSHRMGSSWGA